MVIPHHHLQIRRVRQVFLIEIRQYYCVLQENIDYHVGFFISERNH